MSKKDAARPKPQRINFDARMSAGEVASYLEGLAAGIRTGALTLGDGESAFRAPVEDEARLVLRARRGKRRSRIKLRLTFPTAENAADASSSEAEAGAFEEGAPATLPDVMSF